MKTAFLVIGPESSGTRLMTRILIACGCEGDGGHQQRWDTAMPEAPKIVWRRSAPHGRAWPNIAEMVRTLREKQYAPKALVMHRDWYACAASQCKNKHVSSAQQAYENIRFALNYIHFQLQMLSVPFECVYYDLLDREKYVLGVLQRLDLSFQGSLERIRIEGGKHYGP